jgi:hypothetical protein
MSKLHWSLLALYLTAAAGYGGWRGRDLWSGWGVWCLLLPPLALAAGKTVGEWWRNPYWFTIKMGLAMTVFAVVFIGGPALLLAWSVAEGTERWSAVPAVRAIAGGGLGAAAGGLALLAARSRKVAEPREVSGSESTAGPAEPSAAADRGGI